MNKKITKVIVGMILLSVFFSCGSKSVVEAKHKAYINNKNFAGRFSINGQKETLEGGGYNIEIKKISSNSKVKLQLFRWGSNGTPMSSTELISAKIKGKKCSFKFKDQDQGSKGKATIKFNKNKSLILTVKITYKPDYANYGLDINKGKFKRVSKK